MIDEMIEALLESSALANSVNGESYKDSRRAVEARKALEPFAARLEAAEDALRQIRDRELDKSSTDQTAFFWNWAKDVARAALAASQKEPPESTQFDSDTTLSV